jgi:exopolyphosphatase/guanosine-5'-triphosphate,3'-diphosphate pyrophosphatase
MRVAAIDCGTNSLRLLLADIDDGSMREIRRDMRIVRLGQGVDATGRFAEDALERTFAVCDEYAAECRTQGVERIRFVATSASRDASNRAVFIDGVRERFHVAPEVISGEEEAGLSFAGATRELIGREAQPFLVVDIGGGSTEFVIGDSVPEHARSVDIGCVRMTERHGLAERPSPALIQAAVRDIDAAIERARAEVPIERAGTFVAVAGSATTVAAMALELPKYDASAIHLTRLSRQTVVDVSEAFLRMTGAERMALPFMHPGRVDVIPAGALILRRVMEAGDFAEVLISEHDILDGIAWSVAAR